MGLRIRRPLHVLFPVTLVLRGAQIVLLPDETRFGWEALPFLIRPELLLFPLLPLFAAYAVSLWGLNVARWAPQSYPGS
ncbi:hypothetical protein FRC10_011161 [Ceratobasidium sp. 414]|nr:hypothetical protein FRC10_011161 [Ceratobasidium sp. 414]